jgi:hypothetical protein
VSLWSVSSDSTHSSILPRPLILPVSPTLGCGLHGIILTIVLCHRGLCRGRILEYDRGPCGHHLRLSASHSCLNASSMSDPVWRHYSRSFQAERDSVGESCFQRGGKYSQSSQPQWLVRRKVCAIGGLGTSPKRCRSSSMIWKASAWESRS